MTRNLGRGWLLASVSVALFVLVPVGVVLSSVFRDAQGAWEHLAQTRLSEYIVNTLALATSVGLCAAVIGVSSAWLISTHRFPGRDFLSWALLLPIAVPGYIAAYAMTDLLQFSGPVQSWLRGTFGLSRGDYWFPDIRTLSGAILILSFALYPYVYFAARMALSTVPRSTIEASRTLGHGPWATLLRVTLPLCRPAIIAGVALVVMETIADFGTVEHCAVDTLTTGVYRTWFGLDSQVAASQLASVALLVVGVAIAIEFVSRRRARVHATTARCVSPSPTRLSRPAGAIAAALCALPILIGFALPAGHLSFLTLRHGDARAIELFAGYGFNTFALAAISGLIAITLGLFVVFTARLSRSRVATAVKEVCRAGYALPGPLIAIGVLTCLASFDHALNDSWRSLVSGSSGPGLLVSGTVLAVLIGYQTRFLSIAVSLIDGGMSRINRRLDDAARTLNSRSRSVLLRVHAPMLRGTLLIAALLVFVDVAKELPATLMLRPFNFETLATRVYRLASDERLYEASTGALAIVLVGILPVVILSRFIDSDKRNSQRDRA